MTDELTFSEPVLGFRAWKYGGWVVMPRAVGEPWAPGVQRAVCNAQEFEDTYRLLPPHDAPHGDCECGWYALHADEPLPSGYGHHAQPYEVKGAVAGWGAMEVHASGWRSEFVKILAFEEHDRLDLSRIAKTYGVPIVPKGKLEEEGRKHAQPLPASVIPEYKPPAPVVGGYLRQAYVGSGAAWYSQPTPFTWRTTIIPTAMDLTDDEPSAPSPVPPKPDSKVNKRSNRQGPPKPKRPPRHLKGGGR